MKATKIKSHEENNMNPKQQSESKGEKKKPKFRPVPDDTKPLLQDPVSYEFKIFINSD